MSNAISRPRSKQIRRVLFTSSFSTALSPRFRCEKTVSVVEPPMVPGVAVVLVVPSAPRLLPTAPVAMLPLIVAQLCLRKTQLRRRSDSEYSRR